LRLFIIIAELIALIVVAVWLVAQPGSVTIDVGGYTYQTELYVAFLSLVALFIVVSIVLKAWHFIVLLPARMYAYTQKLRPEKGMRALLQGVIATALEEHDQARAEVARFERNLGENGVQKGLLAFNDLQQGKLDSARVICESMKGDGDEKTLSWILEVHIALKEGKDALALSALQHLYQMHERSPWVLRELLKCSLKLGMYDQALDILKKAERRDVLDPAITKQQRALIHYEQAQAESADLFQKEALLEQAHRLAPDIVKVAVQYAKILRMMEKPKKARKILEQTWTLHPHEDLLEEYITLDHETDPKAIMKVAARLYSYNEHDQNSCLAMAKLAMKLQEWGRARAALHDFQEKYEMTQEACYLMARLELGQHGDQTRYREWMEKAMEYGI